MTIIIYHYHPETGAFSGSSIADISPLEPGVALLPDHATQLPPPQVEAPQVAVFRDGAWIIDAPHHHQQVETLAARLRAGITAERDRREAGTFQYRGRVIDCDPRAVQRITTAAMAAQAALAAGQAFSLDWTCADNSVLQLDAAGVIGMPLALAAFADELHQHARMLKQQVLAAEDEAALSAIDIHHGWPGDAMEGE